MKKPQQKSTHTGQTQNTHNPHCLAEFLRQVPDRLTENQRAFLAKEFIEPYCPDDMYCNLEFICNEIFFCLPDAQLGALLKAQDWNPFVLIENLVGYHLALRALSSCPAPEEIVGYLREVAAALKRNERECLGRNISLWFQKAASPIGRLLHWQKKRYQFLQQSEVFQTELAHLAVQWPKEVGEVYNRNVPQWWMFHNASSGSVLNYEMLPSGTDWGKFVNREKFAIRVQEFMIRWNIEIVKMDNGKLDFVPARVQSVTDVYGQGTYVFIPRYYNWSRIKNDQGDFEHVRAILDKTFEKFSPPKKQSFAERVAECRDYVAQQLAGRHPVNKLLMQFVGDWCRQETKRFDRYGVCIDSGSRVTSPEQQRKYYNAVKKLLTAK